MLQVLDLFSGIGGFSLGLEVSGPFQTAAFVESNAYARRILARHWPEVPRLVDVRSVTAARLAARGIRPDVACGGFPCQDISVAGAGAGLAGARSGLWFEFSRIIGDCRPSFVCIENVPALRSRGGDRVCADLEAMGYAWWAGVVGAVHAGAPHKRQRVWIIAYTPGRGTRCDGRGPLEILAGRGAPLADPDRGQRDGAELDLCPGRHAAHGGGPALADAALCGRDVLAPADPSGDRGEGRPEGTPGGGSLPGRAEALANSEGVRLPTGSCEPREPSTAPQSQRSSDGAGCGYLADAEHGRRQGRRAEGRGGEQDEIAGPALPRGPHADPDRQGLAVGVATDAGRARPQRWADACRAEWWATEPALGRVAHGVPDRVDRLERLGNAIVPAIPAMIGRALIVFAQQMLDRET